MKKLKLELDDLRVESFAATEPAGDQERTVLAAVLTRFGEPGCPNTQAVTCPWAATCAYPSCDTNCDSDGLEAGTCQFLDTCNFPSCNGDC